MQRVCRFVLAAAIVLAASACGDGDSTPPLNPKLVAAGPIDIRVTFPANWRHWIRNAQEYEVILPLIAQVVPSQYLEPDFTQVDLLFLPGFADNLRDQSFVRIERIESSDDGKRHMIHPNIAGTRRT